MRIIFFAFLSAFLFIATAFAQSNQSIVVTRFGSAPAVKASEEYFTGTAYVDSRFEAAAPARTAGGTVVFEPGARTAWHTHPLGQILIVTEGIGWVGSWDGSVQEIKIGDIVRIPAGVKHWHGASPSFGMTHIAIAEALEGKTVEWMEKVEDQQYRGGKGPANREPQ